MEQKPQKEELKRNPDEKKLLCKTRGGASPQGKPRVYVTGHPDDIGLYLDEIAGDILNSQNCAIYYDAEPGAEYDREELLRQLEQMQLLVIPVTGRFLSRPSRALDVEFPFALEHHIPVLPLMQESGLEALFNQTCGDLQMLDKNSKDNTTLSYEEKLEKFLASVLVGDELAEKVRAAFDAYVFLSYRKKDRKYAQELMRLIHKNEFCRDIAIWYDEFLTPGENFNAAIGAALEKCSLFTLAVTPSIVEQGNYVMTVEYPEAVKSGKPILPAELVPTDQDALRTCYQDLPPCTDAHDESALSGALLEAVQKLAIRENEGSPEHNFFIGLAYLNGIDVEVDRERALALITGAAEDGLPEAMEKLVSMYRSGDGVKLDYMEAIRWQEKLAAWGRAWYEKTQTEGDGGGLLAVLWDLGDYWRELARLSAAKDVYQEMYRISKLLLDRFGNAKAKRYLSISYSMLGVISEAEGRLSEAKGYYLQALEIDKGRCEEAPTVQARRDLSNSYSMLGIISEREGRLSEAREYYLQALEMNRQLCEEAPTVQARRGLSATYRYLGRVSEVEDRLSEAKAYYLQALEISKGLCEEAPTAEARRGLSIDYNNLGRVSEAEGQLSEMKEYYLQSLEIAKALCEEAPTVNARRDLSISYNNMAGISEAEGQLSEAKRYCLQALEIRKGLCREAPTLEARHDLSAGYERLGVICEAAGQSSEAKGYFLQTLEIRKGLCEEAPTVQARLDLAVSFDTVGSICEAEGKLSEAEEYHLRAWEVYRALYEEAPNRKHIRYLAFNSKLLGDILVAQGRPTEAKAYFLRSLELYSQIGEEARTVADRRHLYYDCAKLGEIRAAEGCPEDAAMYYAQMEKTVKELCDLTGAAEDFDDLAVAYCYLASVEHDGDAQKKLITQAYEIWNWLSGEHPDQPAFAERTNMVRDSLEQMESE